MAMNDVELYNSISHISVGLTTNVANEIKDKLSWTTGETILDAGCGNGDATINVIKKIAPKDATIVGVDISQDMINFATKHYSGPNVTYKLMDLVDDNLWSTWQKEQFTKIFSFFVINRIKNDRKAYENIYDLLKPGGEALLTVPASHTFDCIFPHLLKLPKYKDYRDVMTKSVLVNGPNDHHVPYARNLLKTIGFDIICCENRILPFVYSTDKIAEVFRMVSYLNETLPPGLYDDVLTDTKKIIEDNKLLNVVEEGYKVTSNVTIIVIKKPQ